jgi:hypothetical protein
LDGPVVTAARKALEEKNVNLILPYVPKEGEAEVIRAFEKAIPLRNDGAVAREVADLYFFETVVRIHRAGEGAPYTGLKPAGLSEGPVIPVAEKAIETGSPDELVNLLCEVVREEVLHKFEQMMHFEARTKRDDAENTLKRVMSRSSQKLRAKANHAMNITNTGNFRHPTCLKL